MRSDVYMNAEAAPIVSIATYSQISTSTTFALVVPEKPRDHRTTICYSYLTWEATEFYRMFLKYWKNIELKPLNTC